MMHDEDAPDHTLRRLRTLAWVILLLMLSGGMFLGYHSSQRTTSRITSPAPVSAANEMTGQAGESPLTEAEDAGDSSTKNDGDKPLPVGITDIEGEGGRGIHRMVLKNGIWFPVYAPGEEGLARLASLSDPDEIPPDTRLNVVPLTITSATPPQAKTREAYSFRLTAVGGTPPYTWSMNLTDGASAFSLQAESGILSGASERALTATMSVAVTDASGGSVGADYAFTVIPEEELRLLTDSLPKAVTGEFYSHAFQAEGGVPPYTWEIAGTLPQEWTLDAATGLLSAVPETSGESTFQIKVRDQQEVTVEKTLSLVVTAGLEITTPSPLRPAAPGSFYEMQFEAEGGTPPLTWSVASGALPRSAGGLSWELDTDGLLSGSVPVGESLHYFEIEVRDSLGLAYRKPFELAIRDTLLARPSRERVGLAWQARLLAREGFSSAMVTRSLNSTSDPGVMIYQGTGSNLVDRNLPVGATCYYTLWGLRPGADPLPYASAFVTLLPFVKQQATAPGSANPFADSVRVFSPLTPGGYGSFFVPQNVTGPPWVAASGAPAQTFAPAWSDQDLVSLHARDASTGLPAGGAIILECVDNIIEDGPGADFTVFENVFFVRGNPNNRFMEPAIVSVALFEEQWHRFPVDVVPMSGTLPDEKNPSYYARGFAGRNATTGDDPTDPARSGGDAFDLSDLRVADLSWVRFIKIEAAGHKAIVDDTGFDPVKHNAETGALSGDQKSGFDLDAVSAVNY